MKGIIMQRKEEKSIVLFNNGKIGEIPTPANCEEGMVISISYNKRIITFVSILSGIVLVCAAIVLLSIYNKPVGFVQINYQNVIIELTYNRFQRIIASRPLNIQAVEPLTAISLNNNSIQAAYERIILTLTGEGVSAVQGPIVVRIAQDNLINARKIEQSLSAMQNNTDVTFRIYTHELYQQAMTALPEPPPDRNRQMQRRRGMNRR